MDGFRNPSSTFTGSETAANLNLANAKTVTVKAKWKSNEPTIPTGACTGSYGGQDNINLAVNGSKTFDYTGNVRCAYLQKAGYYKLEVWGAQGGKPSSSIIGGHGGYSYGNITASANSVVYVVVGEQGKSTNAVSTKTGDSYNGGSWSQNGSSGIGAGGGGGATHISTYNCGELKNCSSYKPSILIVAGGGGGTTGWSSSSTFKGQGGAGGGMNGGDGMSILGTGKEFGNGGTQSGGGSGSSSGTFGDGGIPGNDGTSQTQAGGGGGLYGGGATDIYGAGGGGSGYIGNSLLLSAKGVTKQMYQYSTGCTSSTAAATKTTCTSNVSSSAISNYAKQGNGYARITYLGT